MQPKPASEPAPRLRNAYTVTMAMLSDPRAAVVSCNPAMCNRNGQTVSVLSVRLIANLAVQRISLRGRACCERV